MPIYWDALKTWKGKNKIMVETGSFIGDGIQKGLDAKYNKIFSFEVMPENYNICKERFKNSPEVTCILGDSVKQMPFILNEINESITFWLDSHFIANGECDLHPILNELKIIKNHPIHTHTILIDDVRLFSDGKDPAMSISIQEVKDFILTINPNYKFTYEEGFTDIVKGINNDILVAYLED